MMVARENVEKDGQIVSPYDLPVAAGVVLPEIRVGALLVGYVVVGQVVPHVVLAVFQELAAVQTTAAWSSPALKFVRKSQRAVAEPVACAE